MHTHGIKIATGPGLGGTGFTGRLLFALAIILALKYFDKNKNKQEEYNKAIKTLLAGRALMFIAGLIIGGFLIALFAGPLPIVFNW